MLTVSLLKVDNRTGQVLRFEALRHIQPSVWLKEDAIGDGHASDRVR